jgi:hypothetical protein
MKKKLTLSIEPRLNLRLDIQAAVAGKGHDRSSIVDALILSHIKLPDDWQDFPDSSPGTPEPPEDKPSPRQREKTTVYVSGKASRMLGLHAQLAETNRSRVVEALIDAHVPVWAVYDQREFNKPARRSDRRSAGDAIRDTAEAAA